MNQLKCVRCNFAWAVMLSLAVGCTVINVQAQEQPQPQQEPQPQTQPLQQMQQHVEKLDPVILQLHTKVNAIQVGYVMAIEQGFYAEEGLEVILRPVAIGKGVVSEVQAGHADYFTSGAGMLLRKLRGWDLIVVAVPVPHSNMRIIVRESFEALEAKDFKGMRLGVSLPALDLEAKEFLRQGGLAASDVKVVYRLSPRQAYGALSRGEIDAYFSSDFKKVQSFDGDEGTLAMFKPWNFGVDFIGACLGTSAKELAENPQRVESLRRATLRGWYYAATHQNYTERIMAEKYGASSQETLIALKRFRDDVIRDVEPVGDGQMGDIPIARWETMANALVSLGLIKSWEPSDLDKMIYKPGAEEWAKEAWWLLGVLMGAIAVGLGHVGWRWMLHKGIVARTSVLMDSEAQYRELFTRNVLPIIVLDPESRMPIEFNAAALEMLGFSSSEMLRLGLVDLEVNQDSPEAAQRLNQVFASGQGCYETILRIQNGTLLDVMIRIETIQMGGEPAFELVLEDQTQRKLELNALKTQAQWGRLLADGASEATLLIDDTGLIVEANRTICKRLGFERTALVGLSLSAIDTQWSQSDRRIWLDRFDAGQSVVSSSVFRCEDGAEFEASVRVAAVGEGQQAYRTVVIGTAVNTNNTLDSSGN